MAIQYQLNQLLDYGLKHRLFDILDYTYVANQLIHLLKLHQFDKQEVEEAPLDVITESIMDYAYANGLIKTNSITARDLFESELMNQLMPRPSEVNKMFWSLYNKEKQLATNYFYQLSQASNYIQTKRVQKNIQWKSTTDVGEMDITINLSKPEKDPKEIALARNVPKTGYPQCVICRENEGYSGHLNHPGRHNHRIIELTLNESSWYLQYSPYVYYPEHCIVLSQEHQPMAISKKTFIRLFDFVDAFPHYFIGSNADLPIVGGSILSHDHFQGGNYEFAMMKQPIRMNVQFNRYPCVEAGIVDWPMSVLRLRSKDKQSLINLSTDVLTAWRTYSDYDHAIHAMSNEEPHNTITPIARFVNGIYEMNLVLRNNRTSDEHPLGIFHPHSEHHHIKKENIGLIEVMGLAVLPARLKTEMEEMKEYLISRGKIPLTNEGIKHKEWLDTLLQSYDSIALENVDGIIKTEIAHVFKNILYQCGVFKDDLIFMRFIETFNSKN